MRRRTCFAGIGLAAAVVAAGVATVNGVAAGTPTQRQVVMAHGDDRLPSTTATDWVTYADHVVVVGATSEEQLPLTRAEAERGEGLIGRSVTLQVMDVLWSRKDASQPPPKSWRYNATGWAFTGRNPGNRTPMALHDRPRVEAGHRYIMAIAWQEARCSPGDAPEPARWMGLGEGSELPFDGDVIGQGEIEGRTQTAAQARSLAADAGPDTGLEEEMAGSGATSLAAKLKATPPGERREFGPRTMNGCG